MEVREIFIQACSRRIDGKLGDWKLWGCATRHHCGIEIEHKMLTLRLLLQCYTHARSDDLFEAPVQQCVQRHRTKRRSPLNVTHDFRQKLEKVPLTDL